MVTSRVNLRYLLRSRHIILRYILRSRHETSDSTSYGHVAYPLTVPPTTPTVPPAVTSRGACGHVPRSTGAEGGPGDGVALGDGDKEYRTRNLNPKP